MYFKSLFQWNNLLIKMGRLLSLVASFILLTPEAYALATKRWQTKNGVRVIFSQAMDVPMLTIHLAFAAGSAYDEKQLGLSTLTTNLLNQGNGPYNATQLADKLASTGAQYSGTNSRDIAVFSLKTLVQPNTLQPATQLFSLIINKPNFDSDSLIQEKKQQLIAIQHAQESPDEVANQLFFSTLYSNHPYGHSLEGTQDSVSQLTRQDVQRFYKKYFVGHNAILVMVGAINESQAQQLAEQLVGNLPSGTKAAPVVKAAPLKTSKRVAVSFPSSQTMLRLGQVGIDHHTSHYFPLTVGNYILGGGSLVSRLANEVREKHGLTYHVASQFMPMPGDGPFLISLSTQNKRAHTALDLTEETLTHFITEGSNEDELVAAKRYLTGNFPLSLAGNDNKASMLLRMAFYNLPDNYLDTYIQHVNEVTTAEIKQAFNQQINQKAMLLVSVGTL